MIGHIDDLAELYVLGDLDARQGAYVERHAAECEGCRARLHEARQAIASIAELEPRHELPPHLADRISSSIVAARTPDRRRWRLSAVPAATIVLLAVFLGQVSRQNGYLRQEIARDDTAIGQMAVTAFDRAPFHTRSGAATGAQVLYSPNGDWYYVVVMHPTSHMQLAYARNRKLENLGDVRVRGDCGTLYVSTHRRVRELAILDNGVVVAEAKLAFP